MRHRIVVLLSLVFVVSITTGAIAQTTGPRAATTSVGASGSSGGSAIAGTISVGSANGIPFAISGSIVTPNGTIPFSGTPMPIAGPGGSISYNVEIQNPSTGPNVLGFFGKIHWDPTNPSQLSASGTGGTGPGNTFPINIP